MVSRCKFAGSSEIGAYARLTNTYFLGSSYSEGIVTDTLREKITVIETSIAGTSIVGRLTIGNSRGLLLPHTTSSLEVDRIKSQLPDGVEMRVVHEPFSALGNVISCNDKLAIVHPELDPETLEAITDILQVETVPFMIGEDGLVGSYSVFTNKGGAVGPGMDVETLNNLRSMFDLQIEPVTVNSGSYLVGAGVLVNDDTLFGGWDCTAQEIATLSRIFKVGSDETFDDGTFFDNFTL